MTVEQRIRDLEDQLEKLNWNRDAEKARFQPHRPTIIRLSAKIAAVEGQIKALVPKQNMADELTEQ